MNIWLIISIVLNIIFALGLVLFWLDAKSWADVLEKLMLVADWERYGKETARQLNDAYDKRLAALRTEKQELDAKLTAALKRTGELL